MTVEQTTMGERYTRAMNSSHLEVVERRTGDVDVIIAAGWVPEHLGTTLQRLAKEFDQVRGDVVNARRHATQKNVEATKMEREARSYRRAAARLSKPKDDDAIHSLTRMAEALVKDAVDLRKAGEWGVVSARAVILLQLKTLARAGEEMREWAMVRAWREKFMRLPPMPTEAGPALPQAMAAWRDRVKVRNRTIHILAGRVLDAFLDDICSGCQGRGFNGGVSRTDPQMICRDCAGSGNRLQVLGDTTAENDFALSMLMSLQILVQSVERSMKASLRTHEAA